jgi:diaminopimelate decarboxylase
MFRFEYQDGELYCDSLPLSALAEKHGTPLYVYSAASIRASHTSFDLAFRGTPHTICYSVKANSNLAILRLLARLGAGFDVVSGGELLRVARAAKAQLKRTVFSGVGKTEAELDAALRAGILLFNVESEEELELLARRAATLKRRALIALRVNPDVDARTHPHISTGSREHKFGVALGDAPRLYRWAAREKWIEVDGVSVHIGSQITSMAPFRNTMQRVAELVRRLRRDGHRIQFVDAGGGLGIDYRHSVADPANQRAIKRRIAEYASTVTRPLKGLDIHLLLEPGRAFVGAAGLLLTRVLYRKQSGRRRFVITDAAMNDLLRPTLYDAYHEIVPVKKTTRPKRKVDIAGPVCETGDVFARDRLLPEAAPGDLLAILDTGAYGMSLASNYNTRPRPAEVLVDGNRATVIRRRESLDDLLRQERRP